MDGATIPYLTLTGAVVVAAPWLVSGPGAAGDPVDLVDLDGDGRTTRVPVAAHASTACDPTWCVTRSTDAAGHSVLDLAHPDGSDRRRLGDSSTSLVAQDATSLELLSAAEKSIRAGIRV